MPNRTASITPEFQSLNDSLVQLEREPSFALALKTISTITSFLGIPTFGTERLYNVDKIKQNPGWFVSADGFADRRACYKLAEDNTQNLDIKVYWIQKTSKRIISSAVMFTPNFEDEPFNVDLKVGIDFFIPPSADRIIIALSNRYLIRTLELSGSLSLTQQEIFTKWIQKFDFSNKAQAHQVLWESLDLQPLNKQFYKEVTRFFTELIQHLETGTKLFQSKEAAQFTNRLVGRLIFCWFLRKKQIIADDRAYFEIDESVDSSAYYHNRLEKLFFSILNTKIEERNEEDKTTPFLNGGLFEAKQTDHRANKDLTFPKDYFHRFFQFLDGYNFTTDESTSEFQQVAIDPEMLGRIFENLLAEQTEETGQQARKAKGAFYTPREIVDYMCKESLREYVRTRLPDDNKRDHVLELLFDKKEHQFDYSNYRADIQPYKKNILDALDEITILDPACGSGAFPMGMLQLMLSIYERIDARFDSYKTKLGIVKNNLFGVDIEPMAVEISRLRAWLSIIVDVDMNPTKENLGIEPLPNLEFKFVAANSLIPLEAGGTEQMEFDNKNLQEEMSRIRDRYFNTNSGKVKEKMKLDYEKLLCSGNTMFKSDRQKKLLTYHPFDSSKSAGFFDPKLMFGLEGFDVVIGNPPYVDSETMKKTDETLRDLYRYTYSNLEGNWDLFVVFIERGIQLVTEGGLLAFIIPNKFIASKYSSSNRKLLATKQIIEVRDYSRINVFLTASVYPVTFIVKNSLHSPDNHTSMVAMKNLLSIEATNSILLSDIEKSVSWDHFFLPARETSLLLKISVQPVLSKQFKHVYGAATVSEAYVLKKLIKDEELSEDTKRFINTGTIDSYKSLWGEKPTQYIKSSYQYPVVLSSDLLKMSSTRFNQANAPKIILAGMTKGLEAFLDLHGKYLAGKSTMIILDEINRLLFLLGILNSKLMKFYVNATSHSIKMAGGFINVGKDLVNKLPIPEYTEKRIAIEFSNLVEKNLEARGIDLSLNTRIDEVVMDLYQLTEEEKEIIRNS